MKIDPEFIFITGVNEWVAQRFITNSGQKFLGKKLPDGGTFFVDQYNQEFSRDIEPMKDGHTDNYYYQMIANIRRYKGIRKPQTSAGPHEIKIDGDFSDWNQVRPEFKDPIGDTIHRNETGWGNAGEYVNSTGRNDFVLAKVAHDADNIYFYIETKDPVTPRTDKNWMLLFIDADCNPSTGWQGYDYRINARVQNAFATSLQHTEKGADWKDAGRCGYRVKANRMEIRIPRDKIDCPQKVKLDFHLADNIQKPNDIIEFSISGDSAPDRRFNYRYME